MQIQLQIQLQLQLQIHKYKQSRMADAQQPDTLLADLALPSFFSHVRHQKAWNSPQSSFLRFFCINGTKTKSIPGSFRLPCGDRHAGERSTLHSQMIEGMMFNCTLYMRTCVTLYLWQDKKLFPFNGATVPRLYATVIVPLQHCHYQDAPAWKCCSTSTVSPSLRHNCHCRDAPPVTPTSNLCILPLQLKLRGCFYIRITALHDEITLQQYWVCNR